MLNRFYVFLHGIYQICLSVWMGGAVMFAIAAAITFKVSRKMDPSIGHEKYQGEIFKGGEGVEPIFLESEVFAGQIVGSLADFLTAVIAICVVYIGLFLVLEATTFHRMLKKGIGRWIRLACLVGAIVLYLVSASVFQPRMNELNDLRYDQQTKVVERNHASASFERYHKLSERLMTIEILLLIGVYFTGAHRGDGIFNDS